MDEVGDEKQRSEQSEGGGSRSDIESTPRTFEEFLALLPEPAVMLKGTTVVSGNAAFADIFDQQVSALQGTSLASLFPDIDEQAVEDNCEAATGEYLTCRGATESEADVWLDLTFARRRVGGRSFVVGIVHDVSEYRQHAWELEQYERIIEAMEDGVFTVDESFTIQTVNDAITSMTGHDRETLIGSPATLLADESVIERAAAISEELLSGERDFGTLTTELETADGDSLPIETRFTAHRRDDGQYRQVGVVRDISDRRRFERTLAALHESTRELLQAETAEAVSDIIVESATDVLDADHAAVYQFEAATNVLKPQTLSETLAETDATPPVVESGTSPLWESFVSGKLHLLEPDDDPFPSADVPGAVCLPLGEYGVLYVALDVDEHDDDTIEVLEMLAASGEAALARVNREQDLRKRDERLHEQNRELRQLKEVNGIIRHIHKVLADADTCAEIEQSVCDQLVRSQWISFAWLGSRDANELEPLAWAGDSPDYLDAVSLTATQSDGPPAVKTIQQGGVTVVPAVADGLRTEPWRGEAVSRDYHSALSVPLQTDDFSYGVLTVYGTEQSVFEEMLESVFVELGETIANALRQVETRQRRSAAATTELEVALSAPNTALAQLADQIGAPIVCEGTVPHDGERTRLFFRVDSDDVDAAAIRRSALELTRVESVTPISEEATTVLFEAVVTGETVTQWLLDEGARNESVRAEPQRPLVVTALLASSVGVRTFVERLDDRYDGATLTARREQTAPAQTESGIHAAMDDMLTERQQEVFRTAYFSGFFDWPRKSSGQDIADRLDISQPTVSRHLRIAERKLLELLYGEK